MRTLLAITVLLILRLPVFGQMAPDDSLKLQSLIATSRANAARKNFPEAIRYLRLYHVKKDSVLQVANKAALARLQQHYQTAKKDQQLQSGEKNIGLLTAQNRLMEANLNQAVSIRRLILTMAIAVALLLAISYLQYRSKQKANLRLQVLQSAVGEKNNALLHLAEQKDGLLSEKEILIKEIHHRVKNNLQVVISLLNTQSAYLNDAQASAAIRQSQHRMQSISLIHQKLYQSESRALIGMKDYIAELIQYLQQSFGTGSRIVFKTDIDDIELDVMRAVPIGLILNEAITNAIKYAFAAEGAGSIEVGLKCLGEQQLQLTITDNGSGLPAGFDLDLCQSLGINLMKTMCRQLKGNLCLQSKQGLIINIGFPLASGPANTIADDDISSIGGGIK